MKKRMISVVVVFALLITSALAASSYQAITVDYNINLEINDSRPELTDVNGNVVKPFIYSGTTYVPIRAVSETMGASVGYDANSRTAIIYQDDVMAMIVAHEIGDTSQEIRWAVENALQCCELYNEGAMGFSEAVTMIKQIGDDVSTTINATIYRFNNDIYADNLYYDGLSICMQKLNEEVNLLEQAFTQAGLFMNNRSQAAFSSLFAFRNSIVLQKSAVNAVNNFMDGMW